MAASPTVAWLVARLEASDVILMTTVTMVPGGIAGDLRFLDTTATARILHVRVDNRQAPLDRMAWLAHELQHAVEVAGAVEVRSPADLAALMNRISRVLGSRQYFETAAAIECGRQASRELAAALRLQRRGNNALLGDSGLAHVTRPVR